MDKKEIYPLANGDRVSIPLVKTTFAALKKIEEAHPQTAQQILDEVMRILTTDGDSSKLSATTRDILHSHLLLEANGRFHPTMISLLIRLIKTKKGKFTAELPSDLP